jgi:SRSO17 transposase
LLRTITKKKLVRLVKERYRTERVYEGLKGKLGLDHFEGRRFPAWHHHVTVALSCFAFIVAERVRRFSPLSRAQEDDHPLARETGASLPGLVRYGTPGLREDHRHLAPEVPALPAGR